MLAGTVDLDMARAALARDASGTDLRTAVRAAADLIARHAAVVEAVARALLAKGALDGDALAAIMAAHAPGGPDCRR